MSTSEVSNNYALGEYEARMWQLLYAVSISATMNEWDIR